MQRPPGQPFPGDSPEPSVDEKAARRLQVLFRFAIGWAILIGLRLFHLQIVSHADYKKQANAQHERVLEIPAPRGAILDRDDRTLALSITLKSVVANPLLMPDLPVTAEVLARVLSLDGRELLHRMKTASATGSGFLWVKRKVTTEEAERVRLLKLTGVEFRDETSRMYPKGSLAAHVLGSVDHEDRGSAGIELGLQDELEGIPGALRMQKDVTNRGYGSQVETKPQPGKNITLTIDERVQHIAERELMKAVEGCKCKTGSVVVMDPHNGDILAMASYPTYDPNELPKRGESLSARLNLAISAPFEPGSVFKVITLAAALETTSMGPESPVNCMNGAMPLAGRVIHEAKRGFGVLPMRTVLAKSSNIGAIQVGIKVGIKNLYAYIMRFGFGKRTGLPLPAEEPGRVFEPRKWGPQSIGSVPMGHEVTTTTIQLAQACAVVANDGLLVRPRIVLRRHRPGDPIEVEPVAQPARVLEARNAARMRDMMHDVVLQGGTGFPNAVVPGYDSAGKTGSAQIYDHASKVYTHKYNASFIGMAPLNNPRVVVAVTLNGSPLYGGTVAAPVFREVTGAALRILDVPKTAGEGMLLSALPVSDPENESDLASAPMSPTPEGALEPTESGQTAVLQAASYERASGPPAPNLVGKSMREVLSLTAAAGILVEPRGSGIARAQHPAAGVRLQSGEHIVVEFGR